MTQIISKDCLDQSIELISELNLNEEDYNRILEKFSIILKNKVIKKRYNHLLKEIIGENEINEDIELKDLLRKIVFIVPIDDFNEMVSEIVKHEELIDFIQDLFLEKLI